MTSMTTEPSTPAETDAAVTVVPTPTEEEELIVQPKRPLSAYNYFFRSERARLVGEDLDLNEVADVHNRTKKRRHRKTHGKLGFREMANKVGESWRGLSDEDKTPFVQMFHVDRARYKTEVEAWNDQKKEKKKETLQKKKEAAKLAKAEEKKRKRLETKKLKEEEKEKAEKLAATAAAAAEVMIELEEVYPMDNIINEALDLLNDGEHHFVATVSASDDAADPEEDANSTTADADADDFINRAMDIMLNDDIVPASFNKRASRDCAIGSSKILKNSMLSMDNTLMDFDRFLEDFEDEHCVSDDSSAGGEDNEGAGCRIP
jgi:flagellar biosynthesis GTPase FlhF